MTSIGRTVAAISLTLVALLICSNATALGGRRTYLEVDVEITREPLSIGALSSQLLLESTCARLHIASKLMLKRV